MIQLRFWIAATLVWLLGFYNIERFHEPINIASFVYVLAAAFAIAVVACVPLRRARFAWLLSGSLSVFLALKWGLGHAILGPALPLTVTEVVALTLTLWLARRIAGSIDEFEEGALDMLTMHLAEEPASFESGQGDLYHEVHRAREFHRPLALMALSADGKSTSATINRFLAEVERRTIRKYIDARLADLLARETKDCDIVAQRGGHFLVLLPEVTSARVESIVRRLKEAASEKLGLKLQVGVATFPDQEVTFTGLLERAAEGMRSAVHAASGNGQSVVESDAVEEHDEPLAREPVLTPQPE